MSGPSSAPPPSSSSDPGTFVAAARHEHVLELEAGGKGWKRRRSADFLKLSPDGIELHHGGVLQEPLVMPLGAITVAAAEPGPARALPMEGRFPVLRRLSAVAVVPREEGVEGWLWTSRGGSAFLSLCEDDDAPNTALVFAHALGEDLVTGRLRPADARRRRDAGAEHVPQVRPGEPADRQRGRADAAALAPDRRLGRSRGGLQRRGARHPLGRSARPRVIGEPGPPGPAFPRYRQRGERPALRPPGLPRMPWHGQDRVQPRRLAEHRDLPVVRRRRALHPGARRAGEGRLSDDTRSSSTTAA